MADQTDKMVPGSKEYTKPILDSRSVTDIPKIIWTMKKSFDDAAAKNKPLDDAHIQRMKDIIKKYNDKNKKNQKKNKNKKKTKPKKLTGYICKTR